MKVYLTRAYWWGVWSMALRPVLLEYVKSTTHTQIDDRVLDAADLLARVFLKPEDKKDALDS